MWVEINSAAQVEDKDRSQMPAADTQDAILFLSQVNLPANTHTQKKKKRTVCQKYIPLFLWCLLIILF